MKYLIIFRVFILLKITVTQLNGEEFCSIGGQDALNCITREVPGSNHMYSEDSNNLHYKYRKYIDDAVSTYKPCSQKNCSCFMSVIKEDLASFANGITQEMIEKARAKGTKYQIIDHQLYRDEECMFPARCSGVEHFLKPLLDTLPDMELVVNTRDWPQVSRHFGEKLPVFSFSKTDEFLDIMYPAWGFWGGGPAIGLYPRGLGRWDLHRTSLSAASDKWPWDRKSSLAFFRGSRTSGERDALVMLSRERPDLVDAQYTKNQAWKSDMDTLNAPAAKEVSLEDHCQFRYLFNFRGVAASFRLKHLFLCGSLVFHVGDEWQEFFYAALKPWVHYVPVPRAATQLDISELLEGMAANDAMAREIAKRGQEFVLKRLRMTDVSCYWRRLLERYAKLLTFAPQRDHSLRVV